MAAIMRYFQIHFSEWKGVYFDLNVTELCPKGPIDNNPALI